jgi:delta24-sterol reductase
LKHHGVLAGTVVRIYNFLGVNFRALALTIFVLPCSFVLRAYFMFLEKLTIYRGKQLCGEEAHRHKAASVARDVKNWASMPKETRGRLCTSRAPWQNLSMRFSDYKKTSHCVNVGHLSSIVSFDAANRTVHLEPMVTVGQITRYLVPLGYMLEATLEVEEATLGGLAMAVGMTTHAHVCGLLQETVVAWEIVNAQGELKYVTRDSDEELWSTLPWSHGSLGLLVGLVMRVMPVEQTVKLTFEPFESQASLCKAIRDASLAEKPADFVEATIFSPERGILMQASFEKSPPRHDRISRWYQPWFYIQCREHMSKKGKTVQYIETYEYIFRHNRGIFWTLADQLPERVANHPVYRYLLGWLFPPLVTFLKLPAQTERIRGEMMYQRVYQDLVMPISALEDGIKMSTELFDMWPLLVYPSKIACGRKGIFPEPRPEDVVPGKDYAMYMDLGCYGIPRQVQKSQPFEAIVSARKCEEFMTQKRGVPFLYANTFYSREEFNAAFDAGPGTLYQTVRERTRAADAFPDVYEKTAYKQGWKELELKEKQFWKEVASETTFNPIPWMA